MMVARVTIHDDMTDEPGASTYTFGVAGVEYEIDLTTDNHDKLVDALTPWIIAARRVGKRPAPNVKPQTSAPRTASKTPKRWYSFHQSDGQGTRRLKTSYREDVVLWAHERGYKLKSGERPPDVVFDAYDAEHPDDPRKQTLTGT